MNHRNGWRNGRAVLVFTLMVVNLALQVPPGRASAFKPLAAPTSGLSQGTVGLVIRIYFTSMADRDRLAGAVDALETSTSGGYLTAIVDDVEYRALAAAGYRVEVDQARTALLNRPIERLQNQAGGIPGFPCYRTVEETYASLVQLAGQHPDIARWIAVGQSWKKVTSGGAAGYDLGALVLTNKARPGPKPVFFLMAAIHAREYATAELATRYAEYLANQYGHDPDVTWLLDYFEVVVLPQANPDGRKLAEAGYYQRKNVNNTNAGACFDPPQPGNQFGTDLNRNSSFQWGVIGASTAPCSEVYQGPSALSEPETQAIQHELAAVFPDQRGPALTDPAPLTATGVFITLHSYGGDILLPWGFTPNPAPNGAELQTLGRKFGYFTAYKVCQAPAGGCLYATSGTTDDWSYGELGVASYTFEVGTDFFEACANFDNIIWPANLPALTYAAKAARRPYLNPAGPDSIQVTTTVSTVDAGQSLTLTATADDTRYSSNGFGNQPTQNIAGARYSLDAPAWITGTVTHSLAASDGAFNSSVENLRAVVDTTGWTPGRHLLFVESQDADGNWGVPTSTFVTVIPPYALTASPAVVAAAGWPGTSVTATVRLTQAGFLPDTFTVTVTGNAWPVAFVHTLGPLAQGQTATLPLTVTVPLTAQAGTHDTAAVTIASAGDPASQAAVSLITTALPYRTYFPLVGR